MVETNLPIACTLSESELEQRRREVLQRVRDAVSSVEELEHGFIYKFTAAPGRIDELGNLIALEHACCPFLRFSLTIEPGDGAISLELTGPIGTKEFLATDGIKTRGPFSGLH